ncbi:MAG: helix-hairpin-helix domain-containing protein [Acidobacteria bacterium]|nr:helix-hairpin-helix domain-containing protein [Acidobacteriota bacterium]MCB9399278.1 helix-hairpin-helix domain-containing protein [Acidobacteriota bacterium]
MKTLLRSSRLLLCLLSLFAVQAVWAADPPASSKTQQVEKQQLVSINKATQSELETLPRIGPATAQRIIAFREEHKGFKSLEELMNVKGIGPKTFEKLKPLISL